MGATFIIYMDNVPSIKCGKEAGLKTTMSPAKLLLIIKGNLTEGQNFGTLQYYRFVLLQKTHLLMMAVTPNLLAWV